MGVLRFLMMRERGGGWRFSSFMESRAGCVGG